MIGVEIDHVEVARENGWYGSGVPIEPPIKRQIYIRQGETKIPLSDEDARHLILMLQAVTLGTFPKAEE